MFEDHGATMLRAYGAARTLRADLARRLADPDLPDGRFDSLLALYEEATALVHACAGPAGTPPTFWSAFAALLGRLDALDAAGTPRPIEVAAAREAAAAHRRRLAAVEIPAPIRGQLDLLLDLLDEAIDRYAQARLAQAEFHVIVQRAHAAVEDALFTVAQLAA